MSDDFTGNMDAGTAEVDAPDIGTSIEAEATPSAPPEYLDTDTYAGHHVRLKVDGEDVEVPLNEALQGYSRQSDYTRKTQALAEQQREAQFAITLQKALEANPQATLRLLQEQYGTSITPDDVDDDDEWLDPTEARFKEYDQRLQQAEQFRADQELQVALRVLQQQFGEDFDAREVVNRAAQLGRMDLANIHKEMMFDKFWAQRQAQTEADRRRQADDAKRVAAKQGMTAHVGGGASGAAAEVAESGTAPTIHEAYQQAKRKLGI